MRKWLPTIIIVLIFIFMMSGITYSEFITRQKANSVRYIITTPTNCYIGTNVNPPTRNSPYWDFVDRSSGKIIKLTGTVTVEPK